MNKMLCIGALILAGCQGKIDAPTEIEAIIQAPARYDGQYVYIKGTVTHNLKLIGKGYSITDGAGHKLMVHANNNLPLPEIGSMLSVNGYIVVVAQFGPTTLGVYLQEQQRE